MEVSTALANATTCKPVPTEQPQAFSRTAAYDKVMIIICIVTQHPCMHHQWLTVSIETKLLLPQSNLHH
jgi:hypothetical protein